MTGLPAGWKVEIYLHGAWVDVTPWHAGEQPTTLHAGRNNEFSDISPGTWSFSLRNEDGRFTPRTAVSPYYPNVVPGAPARISVTQDSTTWWVATGKVISWEPTWPGQGVVGGLVTVSCSDALRDLAGHTMDDRWTEEARALARDQGTWVDIPALNGKETDSGLGNIGVTTTTLGACTIETIGNGTLNFSGGTGLLLARDASIGVSYGIGPILRLDPQAAPGTIDFWLQVGDHYTSAYQAAVVLYDSGGVLGSLNFSPNTGVLDLTLGAAGPVLIPTVSDGVWRHVSLQPSAGATLIMISQWDAVAGAVTTTTALAAWDMTATVSIRWGGTVGNANSAELHVAGIVVSGGAIPMPTERGLTGQTADAVTQFGVLQRYVPTVTAWAYTGGENRTIGEPTWFGKTALDVLQQLARTINGVGWCRPDGVVELIAGDKARPASPAGALDVAGDLDAQKCAPTFRDASDAQPTRVTITYANGSVTSVDTAAEAAGRPRVETSIDTCAADQASALFAGSYVLTAMDALRISQLAVDLYSSQTDLWSVMLTLFPTQMLGTSGWPVQIAGATGVSVHVEGWALEISEAAWQYVFDCSPTGLFPSASWDAGDEYGRWAFGTATVTGGTAVGSTSNGTMVITFTGSAGLTLDAGQYPLYLDWNGEAVQISAPPAGPTSPQTVTTAARGALSTGAQVHLAGEPVELWKCAVFGF